MGSEGLNLCPLKLQQQGEMQQKDHRNRVSDYTKAKDVGDDSSSIISCSSPLTETAWLSPTAEDLSFLSLDDDPDLETDSAEVVIFPHDGKDLKVQLRMRGFETS